MLWRLKNNSSVFLYMVIFVFLSLFNLSFVSADTGVPDTISYQGRLTDSGGNALGGSGTVYYFKFSIWDNPTVGNGTKLWPASNPNSTTLTVRQGSFSVDIGDTDNGYPDVLDYNFNTNSKVYLQIEVSGDNNTFETLTPRSAISSAAFSQVASSVNGTGDSSFGTSTPFLNTLISALSTNVNKAVMVIKGAAGQVANLFNITDSNNNSFFTVTADGKVGVGTSTPSARFSVYNNTVNTDTLFDVYTGTTKALRLAPVSSTTMELRMSANDRPTAFSQFITTHDPLYDQGGALFINAPKVGSGSRLYLGGVNSAGAQTTTVLNLSYVSNIEGMPSVVVQNVGTSASYNPSNSGSVLGNNSGELVLSTGAGAAITPSQGNLGSPGFHFRSHLLDTSYNLSSFTSAFRMNTIATSSTLSKPHTSWETNGTALMSLSMSGNLGVGTTTPAEKLDVVGNIKLTNTLKSYGTVNTSNYSEIFSTTDTANGTIDALYIVPPVNQGRIFFGKSGKTAYSLNFANVSSFENVPANLGLISGTVDGLSASKISSGGTYLMLEAPGNSGNGFISSRDSATLSRNSLAFIFHANDSDTYKRTSGFIFAGKENSTNWTSPHTVWTNDGESTRLMTLNNNGNLGIGTTTPTEALSVSGNINLTGALKINGDAGTNGYILQTTGTGMQWIATSSLGISQDLNILNSIVFGNGNATSTLGANAVALGYRNSATVLNSVLVGNQNFAGNATTSVALGILNNSTGGTINTTTGVISGTVTATSTIGLLSTSVGVWNTSKGNQSATVGYNNFSNALRSTAIGYNNITNGSYSTAVGHLNVISSASADYASVFGASNNVSSGDASIAIGYANTVSATLAMVYGRTNTGAGNSSMIFGTSNSITGAGASVSSGAYGYSNSITSSSGSYAFGYNNTLSANSTFAYGGGITNSTAASLMIGPSNTAKMTILSTGNTGIGLTAPLDKLQVFGDIRVGTTSTNGCIKDYSGTGIIGTCSSDERLKTNIVDLSDGYLDKMANLKVISYQWNDTARDLNNVDTTVTNYGLIAQNVEEIFPELVSVDSNGYKQVNYSRIPLYLLKSIQELTKKVIAFSEEFRTKKLCVGDTCINEDQLKTLLQNQNVQASTPIVNTQPAVVEPVVEETVATTTEPTVTEETVVPEPTPTPTPEPVVTPTPEPEPVPVPEPVVENNNITSVE